ncbi:MAG: hypothetical protein ACI4RF_07220 [Eubacterium sp.]
MQKTRAKLPVLLMIITVIAACILHFFQLYRQSDGSAEELQNNNFSSYFIYLLIFLGIIFAAVYSVLKKNTAKIFDFENGSNSIFLPSVILALTFFYDFIHQGYNCYSYISSVAYVEYAYIIPLGISGAFALISCFYFFTLAMTAKSLGYDFRNFTLLHFAPVIWAFTKLCGIMVQIVDIKLNVEICCEFILLCVILVFLFSIISAIDRKDEPVGRVFVFSSSMLSFMSCIVGIPRIAIIVSEKESTIGQVTFSAVTYIMLGVFSLALLYDINKRSNKKQ